MNNKNKHSRLASLVGVLLWLWSALAIAELRVIVEYDQTGHRVVQAVQLPQSVTQPESLTGLARGNPLTHVTLRWFDADGQLLHIGSIVDPRMTHAPISDTDKSPQMLGLDKGAYAVSGPADSTLLELILPASPKLGLSPKTYRLNLTK